MKAERLWEALGEAGDSYIEDKWKKPKRKAVENSCCRRTAGFLLFYGSSPSGGGGAGFLSGTVSDITRCGTVFYPCPRIL